MPQKPEHIKCAKRLLGKNNPLIHQLLDMTVKRFGAHHRYDTHLDIEYLQAIYKLFGQDGLREAILHVLQDYGVIKKEDYNYKKVKYAEKTS